MILYFCKVKCHTELVNWGIIPGSSFSYSWLTPTPSSLDWVVQAGSEEPLGLLWALAKEGHLCCRLHIIPRHSPRVSMIHPELPKPDRQGQITTNHPWHTGQPISFVFNCFHSWFLSVLHSWTCWLAQQVSGVGVPHVPAWWCLLWMLQGTKALSCSVL